jgi:vacuolar-type H+-ATPase subunit C/Vma6
VLNPRYAFISACLKGEEPKIVTSEHIDKMKAASNLEDALAIIRETDVGSYLEESALRTFDDLDERLWRYLAQRIRYVESFHFLPRDVLEISRAYIVKYDVLNIKAVLQRVSGAQKTSMIPIGIIDNNELLEELSNVEDVDAIIQILIKCKLADYAPVLEEYKIDKSSKSRFVAEAKLDGEYYKSMLNMARRIKDGMVLTKALGLVIDLRNLQIASRAMIEGMGPDAAESIIPGGYRITDKAIKELLPLKISDISARLEDTQYQEITNELSSDYDKNKNITAVDEIMDKHKFRILKDMLSPRVLSPLVMAWYLILKETEIRNLRLVLKTIVDGVPVQEIENYLVL